MAEAAADSKAEGRAQQWKVVGGQKQKSSGGIIVRKDRALESEQEEQRLCSGALVKQLALQGDRLHYELLEGEGPQRGWVAIKLKEKRLLEKIGEEIVAPPSGPASRLVLWPRRKKAAEPQKPAKRFKRIVILGPFATATNAIRIDVQTHFDATLVNEHRNDDPKWWKHGIQRPGVTVPEDTFFVCMTRDPGHWIQSLGRSQADCTFIEFIPVKLIYNREGQGTYQYQRASSVDQLFDLVEFDGKVYPDALTVWEQTVKSYFDERALPASQMMVVRHEDYLLHWPDVMQELEDRGVPVNPDNPPLEPNEKTAKDDSHPKAARRPRSSTLSDVKDHNARYKGRSEKQMKRLRSIDEELLKMLDYGTGADAVQRWESA